MNSKSNERYSGKGQKEMLKDGTKRTKKILFLVLDDINFFSGMSRPAPGTLSR